MSLNLVRKIQLKLLKKVSVISFQTCFKLHAKSSGLQQLSKSWNWKLWTWNVCCLAEQETWNHVHVSEIMQQLNNILLIARSDIQFLPGGYGNVNINSFRTCITINIHGNSRNRKHKRKREKNSKEFQFTIQRNFELWILFMKHFSAKQIKIIQAWMKLKNNEIQKQKFWINDQSSQNLFLVLF